jgi:hypothetical protein
MLDDDFIYPMETEGIFERYNVIPETVCQFIGLLDKKELWEHDIIEFWLCYSTTQTHTGNNIPSGSYTEPDEPQLIKVRAQVIYDEDRLVWSFSLLSELPYQLHNAFLWQSGDDLLPIIGRAPYCAEEVKSIIADFNVSDEDYLELLQDYGFESEAKLMATINTIDIIGNIHDNE